MREHTVELVLGLLAALGGGGWAGIWFGARRARADIGRTEADTASELVDTALKLLDPYRAQIERQDEAIRRLHHRVDLLGAHVDQLEQFIANAGLQVPPRPIGG